MPYRHRIVIVSASHRCRVVSLPLIFFFCLMLHWVLLHLQVIIVFVLPYQVLLLLCRKRTKTWFLKVSTRLLKFRRSKTYFCIFKTCISDVEERIMHPCVCSSPSNSSYNIIKNIYDKLILIEVNCWSLCFIDSSLEYRAEKVYSGDIDYIYIHVDFVVPMHISFQKGWCPC